MATTTTTIVHGQHARQLLLGLGGARPIWVWGREATATEQERQPRLLIGSGGVLTEIDRAGCHILLLDGRRLIRPR